MSAAEPETLELTAEEKAALIRLLQQMVEDARFPYSPRLAPLKAILEKLVPPPPAAEPLLPLKVGMGRPTGKQGGEGVTRRTDRKAPFPASCELLLLSCARNGLYADFRGGVEIR